MWTNRAWGNISSKTRIRPVCGGDLRTIRLGFRIESVLRNQSSFCFHRFRSSGGTPSMSIYSMHCGVLGMARVR